MNEEAYYLTHRVVILKRVKYYYKNDMERLRKQGENKYREFIRRRKKYKRDYWRNRHLNVSKKEKQKKKKEYKKRQYCEVKKSQFSGQ